MQQRADLVLALRIGAYPSLFECAPHFCGLPAGVYFAGTPSAFERAAANASVAGDGNHWPPNRRCHAYGWTWSRRPPLEDFDADAIAR